MYNEIDMQFQQLQQAMQETENRLSGVVQQLRGSNNPEIREMEYSLRELALSLRQERVMVSDLLSGMHARYSQSFGQASAPQPTVGQSPSGGFLSDFLNSGFGRAIEMGAGFGIGDDLINKLF
jgi:hypothetical protein